MKLRNTNCVVCARITCASIEKSKRFSRNASPAGSPWKHVPDAAGRLHTEKSPPAVLRTDRKPSELDARIPHKLALSNIVLLRWSSLPNRAMSRWMSHERKKTAQSRFTPVHDPL